VAAARANGQLGGRPITLAAYIDTRWWPGFASRVRPNTRRLAPSILGNLKTDLGQLTFERLTPEVCGEWWGRLGERGWGGEHANKHLVYLRLILKKARKDRLLVGDPTKGDSPTDPTVKGERDEALRKLPTEPRTVSIPERHRQQLIDAAGSPLREYVILGYWTAARREDVAAFRVRHFDLATNRVSWVQQKTRRRITLPLPPALRDVVEQLVPGKGPDDFLLPQYDDLKSISQAFRRLCARLTLPTYQYRDLRRSRGTDILNRTGNLKAAQIWLGHSKIETTARVYAHLTDDKLAEIAATC
jgi:integrase